MQKDLTKEWQYLKRQISKFNKQYRVGTPLVEDPEYDQMVLRFKYLSDLLQIRSPQPMDIINTKRKKTKHAMPMLSLEHDFGEDGIKKFMHRVKNLEHIFPIIGEHKIDGIAVSLVYKNGKLIELRTRGNGVIGNVITDKNHLINVPKQLTNNISAEIRGELFITKENFVNLKNDFASARNAVSAMIQSIHKNFVLNMDFIPYNILLADDSHIFTEYSEKIEYLKNLNFNTQEYSMLRDVHACVSYFYDVNQCKDKLQYDVDGIVLKINDLQICDNMGCTAQAPRYAFAIKFHNTGYVTQITDIKFQIGKNGNVTPVAIFNPVVVDGQNISKASMHNYNEYITKQYGIGDTIRIARAGDAVPYIVDKINHVDQNKKLENCPSCGSTLVQYQQTLRCNMNWNCPEQKMLRINHFCSRDALDISILGQKNIKLLIDENIIQLPIDILTIPDRFYLGEINLDIPRLGTKSIKRMLDSIFKIPYKDLANLIYSLGITSIGREHAKTIAKYFNSLDEFLQDFIKQDIKIKNIGIEIRRDIKSFLDDPEETWVYSVGSAIRDLKLCEKKFYSI